MGERCWHNYLEEGACQWNVGIIKVLLFVFIHYFDNPKKHIYISFNLAFDFVGSAWSFVFFIPAKLANDLRLRWISKPDLIHYNIFSYLNYTLNYLFYIDYETSYTTYINHARWHRCLRSDELRVGGNRSARRKPTCLTWWPHDHLTCRRRVSNHIYETLT